MTARPIIAFAAMLASVAGCTSPNTGATVTPEAPPQDEFPYVAQLMVHRCGTLDCHGSVYRNLRVYGDEGLRYSPNDPNARPCIPASTTGDEVAQDYDSVVGLEPESLSTVVANHGADPESLTLIAKSTGLAAHQGGTLFHPGDDAYVCMTSWLAGSTNTTACLDALPLKVCGLPAATSVDGGAP
jgi:hypothetical protein